MKNLLYLVGLVAIVAIAIAVMRNNDTDVVVPDATDVTVEETSEDMMEDDMMAEDEMMAEEADMEADVVVEEESTM